MNILIFSQWFPPEPGGGPARFLEMGREWSAAGHHVNVIAGIPNWPTGMVQAPYRGRMYVHEQVEGMQIHRTWVYPARNEGRGKRILNHLSFLGTSTLTTLLKRIPADVVIATSPPLLAPIAAMLVAKLKRTPMVLDVRDLWPDAIFALGQITNRHVRRGLRRIERALYQVAAAVIPVSEGFVGPIRSRGGRIVRVIPNGADLETFQPGPVDQGLRSELGWNGYFVVMYAGTLGMAHGLRSVVEAAELCRGENIHFVLIGEGADRDILERAASERKLDNLQLLPLQPRSRMPSLYRSADACLVALRPLSLFERFVPSKIFEIMASGRPILASLSGVALRIVLDARAGIPVQQGRADLLADAVRQLRRSPEMATTLGANGRRHAESYFDRKKLALEYLDLLSDLVGRS